LAALIHSRSFVLVVVVVDATICATDMRHRYAPPICATDMVRRYAPPIWCDDMHGRKTEKAKSVLLLALMLFTFVIRYFTFVVLST